MRRKARGLDRRTTRRAAALGYTPALRRLFGTQLLTLVQLTIVLGASTVAFIAVEIEKWLPRRLG